jgi:transcriptional regulator with XRE-family HTH domain
MVDIHKKLQYALESVTLERRQTMSTRTRLGTRIRRRRRELELTQVQLAELTGLPQFHISAIETGRIADIKTETLWQLAKALRVTTDSLLERDDPPAQPVKQRRVGVG